MHIYTCIHVYSSHTEVWQKTWDEGSVEIQGSNFLAKLVNFAQYYLYSNVPSLDPAENPQRDEYHFGVARSSLGHGAEGENHQVC